MEDIEIPSDDVNIPTVKKRKSWTPEEAKLASAKARENKRVKAEMNRRELLARRQLAKLIGAEYERSELAGLFFSSAAKIAEDVLLGNVLVRNGSDAAALVNAFMNMGRLESGESTSNIAHATREDAIDTAKELRDEAQRKISQLNAVPEDAEPQVS